MGAAKESPPPRWGRVGWGWSRRGITIETWGIRSLEASLSTDKKMLRLCFQGHQDYEACMPRGRYV